MAFDRRAGRLVAVAESGEGMETWTFDVCTNTWTQMSPSREPPRFDWAQIAYDIDSDATILFSPEASGWTAWAYDLQASTWTEKQAPPTGPTGDVVWLSSLAYDPVTGLVVTAVSNGDPPLWTYDIETDTWTPIQQANAGPDYPAVIAFDASVDRLVVYGYSGTGDPPYSTWLFDIRTGTWTESRAERPAVEGPCPGCLAGAHLVYDEAAERTLVYMRDPLTTYDASADRWATLTGGEDRVVAPQQMVYDSVNRRLVGWDGGGNLPEGAVEALDLVTGEWTVLLEPGPGQAAP
jgi:hypothetical protein